MKNKLYIKRNKGPNSDLQWRNYTMYRNKLNHLIRKAERKYYQDMLLENKSNLKKSWQIPEGIINKRKYRTTVQEFESNETIVKDGEQISNKFKKFLSMLALIYQGLFQNRTKTQRAGRIETRYHKEHQRMHCNATYSYM